MAEDEESYGAWSEMSLPLWHVPWGSPDAQAVSPYTGEQPRIQELHLRPRVLMNQTG